MIEQTLVILKPDGVERGLETKIKKYYTDAGLKIVKEKRMTADLELMKKHYVDSMAPILGEKSKQAGEKLETKQEILAWGKKILKVLREYLMSGEVVPMIIEGENAIKKVREVTGYTDPISADKGTIRGDLGKDSILQANKENRPVRNLVHASGTRAEARKEIKLWFD